MALQKSRSRIAVKGGGDLRIRELDPSASDTFLSVGYLSSTDLNDEHNFLELMDETGEVADAKSGSEAMKLIGVLKQSGIDEMNLLKNADGKTYEAYYAVTLPNGNVQELHILLAKIKPGPVAQFAAATERTLSLELHALAAAAAFTHTPTAYNYTKGQSWVLIENASAQNPPTETAANVAASAAAAL